MIGPERRGAGPTAKRDLAPIPTAVLVSGSGTNLQAVIEATRRGEFPLDIKLVVSSRPGVLALERARKAHIHAVVRPFHAAQHDRNEYAGKLASLLRSYGIELVLLLGWMHVLAPKFLRAGFSGVLNLHPAYLPEDPAADSVAFPDGTRSQAFRGPRALRDALRAGAPFAGASLIQITEEVDRGPLLARRLMALRPNDDEASALERLHPVEQQVVREGLERWIASRGRS